MAPDAVFSDGARKSGLWAEVEAQRAQLLRRLAIPVSLKVQPRRRLELQALAHLSAHEPGRALQAGADLLQARVVSAVHGEKHARLAQIAGDANIGDGDQACVAYARVFDRPAHQHLTENLPDLARDFFRALTHPSPSIPGRFPPGVG